MSAPLHCYQFEHALPEHVVCGAATLLLDRYVADGGEPEGLDYRNFVPDAVEDWAADQVQRAQAVGLRLAASRWTLTSNGETRVTFRFQCEAEAVLFKALVLRPC